MKFINRAFLMALFAVVVGFAAASQASAQGILSDILKRMDTNNKGLKSLRSNIKMSKHNAQLDEYDLYEGTVQYLPAPAKEKIRVRIDWTKPVEEQLAVGGGKYILYRPRLKQAIVGNVDSAKGNAEAGGALAFMSMSREQLKANYDVAYIGEETVNGSVRTWHIKLTPKSATSYKGADLWVDVNGMPVQAKVIEKNNDSTTIQLTAIDRNATVKADDFVIKPPKDTKIIQG
ncbi:MAG: outer membrane lipoprotein carrier protein LolA [Pyrinomonadaceae bacterium]|nr:outer membrane lipoprotein carrier protein LolA [Blastocatellia bacterium]MCW5955754.1 outer membrane lipoprotein carrier protein LolA [Pyrinomonadaceae bacterium]